MEGDEDLARRVGDLEDQVEALRDLPARMVSMSDGVVACRSSVDEIRESLRDGNERETQRFADLREVLDTRHSALVARLDALAIGQADAATIARKTNWKQVGANVLVVMTAVVVPIVGALIAAGAIGGH